MRGKGCFQQCRMGRDPRIQPVTARNDAPADHDDPGIPSAPRCVCHQRAHSARMPSATTSMHVRHTTRHGTPLATNASPAAGLDRRAHPRRASRRGHRPVRRGHSARKPRLAPPRARIDAHGGAWHGSCFCAPCGRRAPLPLVVRHRAQRRMVARWHHPESHRRLRMDARVTQDTAGLRSMCVEPERRQV